MKKQVTLGALTILIGALFAINADADTFSETLVKLRGEVDRLTRSLEDQKSQNRAELRALNAQKSDLEIQLQREEAQVKALRAAIERRESEASTVKTEAAQLQPTLVQAVAQVRDSVESSLPFKKKERLSELDDIEKAVVQKTLPETRAFGRLWQFVEDEIRLTKENGLYTQPIQIGDQEVLAEVARVGMVAMYYKTDDGSVGHTIQTEDGWRYEPIEDPKQAADVTYLFEAFRKQIRAGAFNLPGSIWTGGAQ